MRWTTLALALALLAVQGELWLGKGNMPQVVSLRMQLADQQRTNDAARARNARTAAEASDLKEGLEMVEEKARAELGMVRPDEILVQFAPRGGAAGTSAAGTSAASTSAAVAVAPRR